MNPARSLLAILGGFVLFQVLTQLLEFTLIGFVAGGPPEDLEAYLAVRNRPGVLAARVGYSMAAGLLAGYLVAKIAGWREVHHALGAAVLVTGHLLLEFTTEFAPPRWAQAGILAAAGPMMLVGAWIRASAAAAEPPRSEEGPPS